MGFVGSEPSQASVSSAGILDGAIVDADINASAAIAISKTAFTAGTGITLSTNTVNVDAAQTGITSLLATDIKIGEDDQTKIDFEDANTINFYANNAKEVVLAENSISPGTNNGTALGTTSLMWSDLFLADGGVINLNNGDVILTHSSNLVTLTGGGLVVGVDDTGHDVKFFGASAGAYMEWDESEDQLRIMGASADATTSTGKLLLATSLTDINANDVIGKIEFQAPHEGGGTDAITVAAGIEAVAQGTFSASVNSTDLIFKTGHSEAATEKFRFTSQGEIGIGGTNYGTDGQVLTSAGAGAATAWEDVEAGGGTVSLVADGSISAGDKVAITSGGKAKTVAALQTGVNNKTLTSINSTGMNEYFTALYHPDEDRFVCVYRDGGNSNYPTALVVDVDSNGDFTEGSEVVINPGTSGHNQLVYDTNVDRMVVFFNNGTLKAYVLEVDNSDNSCAIDSGKEASVSGNNPDSIEAVFDPDTNRIVVIFSTGNGTEINSHVLTVTGGTTNTIAVGSECQLSSDAVGYDTYGIQAIYDTNVDRVLVVWSDSGDSNKLTSVVGTVTGGATNTIAYGSEVHVTDTNTGANSNLWPDMTFDSSTNKAVYFSCNSTLSAAEMYVGTVTGGGTNTCAWGSATAVASGDGSYHNVVTALGDGNIVYAHEDRTKTNGTDLVQIGVGYVSGTTFVSKHSQKLYTTYVDGRMEIIKGGTGDKIVVLAEVGTALFASAPDLPDNAGNFIGIANSGISDTATGDINTVGTTATNQSSLTVGAEYWLTSAGGLSTSSTDFARIGKALTSTTLLIGGIAP